MEKMNPSITELVSNSKTEKGFSYNLVRKMFSKT